MTYQQAEAKAFKAGRDGWTIRMWQNNDGGWGWQWAHMGALMPPENTSAAPKAVALILALSEIP